MSDITKVAGETMPLLPNHENAVIPLEKFTRYILNLNHKDGKHKAIVFESALGYTARNANALISNIRMNINKFPATFKGSNIYGDKYEIVMELKGINGKRVQVVTGWIVDKESNCPRLTSAYVAN